MTTLRISFLWEDDGGMSHEELMDQLMFLGADDIQDEEVEDLSPEPEVVRQPKKKQ